MIIPAVDPCFEYPVYITFSCLLLVCISCLSFTHQSIRPNIYRLRLVAPLPVSSHTLHHQTGRNFVVCDFDTLSEFFRQHQSKQQVLSFYQVSVASPFVASDISNNVSALKDIVR